MAEKYEKDHVRDTVETVDTRIDMEMSVEELLEYINSLDDAEDYFITVIPAENMKVGEIIDGE